MQLKNLLHWWSLFSSWAAVWGVPNTEELVDVPLQLEGGEGVDNEIFSFSNTWRGSNGFIPAAIKLFWIFWDVKTFWCAVGYAFKKSSLSIWLNPKRIFASTRPPYAYFKGPKQPTSRGCRRWEEWGGIQTVIISLSLQSLSNKGVRWLPWPSRISNWYLPILRFVVAGMKTFWS